jgi:hypothetical protein
MVALAGAAGCGDDDDALGEEEFIDQANAICEEGNAELEEIFSAFEVEEPTEEELADGVEEAADNIEGQIEEIRALEGPDDLEEDLDAVLDDAEDAVDQLREAGPALFEGEDPFADINERLRDLGFTTCGQGD